MTTSTRLNHALRVLLAVFGIALVAACSAVTPARDDSAKQLMPKLDAYNITNTADLRGAISNLLAGGAALTGNVQVSAAVKLIEGVAGCYQQAGVYEAQIYTNKSNPLLSGAVLIINKSAATNPAVLLTCFSPAPAAQARLAAPQPCSGGYSATFNGKEYYIGYIGTDGAVCSDLCGQLPNQCAAQ